MVDRFGQSELLADEAGDEATAPDQTARFESPQCPQQVSPRHRQRLVREKVPEDHSPAGKQLPGDGLRKVVRILTLSCLGQQRPAPFPARSAQRCASPADAAADLVAVASAPCIAGGQKGPYGLETVRGDDPARDQIPDPFFDLDGQAPCESADLRMEQCPPCS